MSIWTQAVELARQTPEERNRYVDFLRAVSILFVIIGHWLITTAVWDANSQSLTPVLALEVVDWSAWLTWAFQVMPIFFMVGGYSNAISLESAQRKGQDYATWLAGRLQRLLSPLMLLVLLWGIGSILMVALGASSETVTYLSRTALLPTWFLAIYTAIILLAPLSHRFWRRWGFASLLVFVALAVLTDLAFFKLGWTELGWFNYFWVWLAVHHLGFVWHDGRQGSPALLGLLSVVSLVLLLGLVLGGPYPVAMAGSPGEEVSNTLPPKVTLILLGFAQFGFLLSIEKPMQRLLGNLRLWACTVIINTMIMTVYLWHMTVLLLFFAAGYYAGGLGFGLEVGTGQWWLSRVLWLALLAALLLPLALALSPMERVARPAGAPVPGKLRLIVGAIMAGLGIAVSTLQGFDGSLTSPLSLATLGLILGGAAVCGVPLPRRAAPKDR